MELSKFRQEMADKFIAALKEDKIPWHRGWERMERPVNAVSGQKYHGSNSLWLSYTASERGYSDPRWCTFKQAQENGWRVKKDERGTRIEFFSFYDKLSKKNITSQEAEKIREENPDKYNERIRLVSRTYIVFNGSQIAGIPEYIHKEENNILNKNDLINLRDTLIRNMNVNFSEGGDRAFYLPGKDAIHMPPVSAFKTDYDYMSTFLHESGHATGAKERLDRDLTGSFGSEKYAAEELRAEIASAFTAQLTGIPYGQSELMENHKAYIQSWISILDNKPNELFRAIKDAEKISDYLIDKGELLMERNKEEENERNKSEFERDVEMHHDTVERMNVLGLELVHEDDPEYWDGFLNWRWKDGFVTKDYTGCEHDGFLIDGWEGVEHYVSSIHDLIDNYTLEELKNFETGNYDSMEYDTYFDKEHIQVAIKNYSSYQEHKQRDNELVKRLDNIADISKSMYDNIQSFNQEKMVKEAIRKVLMVKDAFVSELHLEEQEEAEWKIGQIDENQIETMILTGDTEELKDALYEIKAVVSTTDRQRLETLDFVRDVETAIQVAKSEKDKQVSSSNKEHSVTEAEKNLIHGVESRLRGR